MCSLAPDNLNQGDRVMHVDFHPTPIPRPNVINPMPGQYIVLNPKRNAAIAKQIRTPGVVNSTRWSDTETSHLIDIWATRYSSLKHKKRNFKDWEMIAKEVHRRCVMNGSHGLGPRTGSQCKIRIKNIVSEYKKATGKYPQHGAKRTPPFLDVIEKVLNSNDSDESNQPNDDFDDTDIKEEDSVTNVNVTPEVSVTSPVMPPVTQPVMQPVTQPVMQHLMQPVTQHVTQPLMQPVTSPITSPTFVGPSMVLTAFPNTYSNAMATSSVATNPVISLSTLHGNGIHNNELETRPMELNGAVQVANHPAISNSTTPVVSSQKRPSFSKEFIAKPKLSRPYKVVKVHPKRPVKEDEKLLTVVREFMEEQRKREEELFDRLFQQQAETEKRYQEFTLNVIKEIGRLFRPDTSNNTT